MRRASVVLFGVLACLAAGCGDGKTAASSTTIGSFTPATVGELEVPVITSTSTTAAPVPTFTVPPSTVAGASSSSGSTTSPTTVAPTTAAPTTAPPPPPPPVTTPPPPTTRPTTTVPEWTKHPELVPLCTATVRMQNDGSKLVNAVRAPATSVAALNQQFSLTMTRMTDLLPLAPANLAGLVRALHDVAVTAWDPVSRSGSRAEAQPHLDDFLAVIDQPLVGMARALDVSCPGRLSSPSA